MAELLPVPEVAAGATQVVVAEWLVKVGDTFAPGDLLAVIETDKAVVELPAEEPGTLLRTLVEAGLQADVGSPMALIGSPDDLDRDLDRLLADLGVATSAAVDGQADSSALPQPVGDQVSFDSDEAVPLPSVAEESGGRVFVSPIARKLLREAGLSVADVSGTGPRGRIRRRDVDAAIASRSASPQTVTVDAVVPAAEPTAGSWTDVPHTRLRRAVATRLTQSKNEIPHFYLRRVVNLDKLLELRTAINEDSPTRVSVNDLLIRAIAVAHIAVPEANVIWTDDSVRQFHSVDVAVAIASERGLVTPVLRSVQTTPVTSIAQQVKGFVEQANGARLLQQDLEGGSITISNLGMFGVDEFSAIINPPHSAILAVGAGKPTVVAAGGEPTVATCANLVLSVDHRAIDGALAAQWMAALVDVIEHPIRLVI